MAPANKKPSMFLFLTERKTPHKAKRVTRPKITTSNITQPPFTLKNLQFFPFLFYLFFIGLSIAFSLRLFESFFKNPHNRSIKRKR
ncbi:hypothetical protein STFR1_20427 [Bacillus vallismortis]